MLDLLTAAPKEIRFGGRTYKVGALKLKELGELQSWVRQNCPRPTVALASYLHLFETEPARREAIHRAAMEERSWPPQIPTDEANRVLLETPEGQRHFLAVLFRKFQPDLSEAEIDGLMAGLAPLDLLVLLRVAYGDDDLDPEACRAAILRASAATGPLGPPEPDRPDSTGGSSPAPSSSASAA